MKVIITGGSGFFGSHCADAFADAGHTVTVFDSVDLVHEFRSELVLGDIRDSKLIDKVVRDADMIIHAAGVLGTHETLTDPVDAVSSNIIGSLNVMQSAAKYDVPLICISKPNVWLNPYSITKDSMEKFCFMYANEYNAKIAIVKLYNLYGPRQKYHHVRKAIPTWIVEALSGKAVEIYGSGDATMDLIHAGDAAQWIVRAADNFETCKIEPSPQIADDVWSTFPGYNTQILELGSGQEISVNATVELLGKLIDREIEISRVPMRRGETDNTSLCANTAPFVKATGFKPEIALADGLRETIEYYTEKLPQIKALELQ